MIAPRPRYESLPYSMRLRLMAARAAYFQNNPKYNLSLK